MVGEAQGVGQIVAGLVILEALKWLTARFMKRTVGTQYRTAEDCDAFRKECGCKRDEAYKEIVGIVERSEKENRRTRQLIVRSMVNSGASKEAILDALDEAE